MKSRGKDIQGKLVSSMALSEIILLISLTFAVAFLLAQSMPVVSAATAASSTPVATGTSATKLSVVKAGSTAAPGTYTSGTFSVASQSAPFTATTTNPVVISGTAEATTVAQGTTSVTTPASGISVASQAQGVLAGSGATGAYSYKVPFIGAEFSGVTAHLVEGLFWAVILYAGIKMLGPLVGLEGKQADALAIAAVAGVMTFKGLSALGPSGANVITQGFLTKVGAKALLGIGVAIVVFILLYKKEKKQVVTFQCLPFEPALGGSQCEVCNKDPFRPCSEYRCKALGQACELLNKGTGNEQCAWVSKFDVTSPTISPWTDVLKPKDLKYIPDTTIRPPNRGVKIVNADNGCLQPFTKLQFGIQTNEPAQCKIDYTPGNNTGAGRVAYDSMQFFFGDTNQYTYNHTQIVGLPGPQTDVEGVVPILKNDGTFNFYVRCQDANGNVNDDVFVVNYCVDQGPDTTPPIVDSTSIVSGSPVQFNADKVPIEVYTNEPAECKWSRQSKAYEDMENNMQCGVESFQVNSDLLYTCAADLTGIQNSQDNKFYFRCKDQPDKAENERNVMVQSYELVLKGSQPLNIIDVKPNETITGSTETVTVNLEVETDDGAEQGKAICYFSPTGTEDSYVGMFDTNNFRHTQPLDLTTGAYTYYFRCIDAGGNAAQAQTSFSVFVDKQTPMVTRAYKQDALKIVTDEDAECAYSLLNCNYEFQDGIKMIYSNPDQKQNHFAEWKSSAVYYIKCKDAFDNEPSPNSCSIVVSAIDLERNK